MPVLTSAGSNSEVSHLSGHLHGDRSSVSRFDPSFGAIATILAVALLFRRFALPWLSRRRRQHDIRGSPRTEASGSKVPPNIQPLPESFWVRPGQGPDHFAEQASWNISRGEASGTAPVGLGGSVEGSSPGSMEEEERTTPTRDWSRGVSTFLSPGATQESSGLSYPGQVFPADAPGGEESHDVRISSSSLSSSPLEYAGSASGGSVEKGKDNMDDDYSWVHSGPGSVVSASRSSTPFFGQPDDITDGASGSVPIIGGGPSRRRRFELNFAKPPLPPTRPGENPVYLAHRSSFETRRPPDTYAQSVPAGLGIVGAGITRQVDGRGPEPDYNAAATCPRSATSGPTSIDSPSISSYTKGYSTQSIAAPGIHMPQEVDAQAIGTRTRAQLSPDHAITPSSYPSTSPLLPPPPPTTDYQFDLAEIMFPGAGAVDGGIRVIPGPIHNHSVGELVDVKGEVVGVFDDSAEGWKRHTRVYGGGVCLACAAAGGGGFYGARARPEDKR
ncbi:hypothetical protein VMCG_10132 [Cytospora schulzeri]|uniref:Uncharacterized protein n=1 Tax=Cytospora schulzeri TaxID=448051 RepID=A0A423VDA0_9PEZI|nr:hypothetical protein VMCG_10132 [Valsa malicola]